MAYKNPQDNRNYSKKWYHDNKEALKADPAWVEARKESVRRWRTNNREASMLCAAKARAKRLGLEFDLDLSDIVIPKKCPVLGIDLKFTEGKQNQGTPALDRIDNSKGYIKGNVAVISHKANRVKSDLSFEEIKSLYLYAKPLK